MLNIKDCEKKAFEELLKINEIVCVGAGKDFVDICKEYNITDKIKFVIDNYKKNDIIIDGIHVKIVNTENAVKIINKHSILLITSLQYSDEIISQLDKFDEFDGIITFVPEILWDKKVYRSITDLVPYKNIDIEIPKKIHYCWFGKNEMPSEFQKYIETWKQYCSDYEIIRWDETNYDIQKNKYMYDAYKLKKWGFVPDYARLDIIYEHGGFYLDTDVELLRNIDELRNFSFIMGFESENYVNLGLGFGAVKHNKDILNMLQMYENIEFINKNGELNLVASPKYQTEYMVGQGLKKNGDLQAINGGIVLPIDYLSPYDILGRGKVTKNSFSIHHYAGTWVDEKVKEVIKRKRNNQRYILNRTTDYEIEV